ncbi:Heat shock protein 70 family [Sesbania bispinosa]|nr:Heat shock protein 70 family [Sesbania bispinosa]
MDPPFSCNLKTEEARDELRYDFPPPSTLRHLKEKASQIDTKKTHILSIDGGGTIAIVISDTLVHLEDQIRLQTSVPHALIVSGQCRNQIDSDRRTLTFPSHIINQIGIDLRTTYSCFERLIDDAAKNQAAMYLTNTVFDAKRLIGRRFNDSFIDSSVQSDMKLWLFKVNVGVGDNPMIVVNYKGGGGSVFCRRDIFHGSYEDEGDCKFT